MSSSVKPKCLLGSGGVTAYLTEIIGLVGNVFSLHVFKYMGTILAVIRTVGTIPQGFGFVHLGVDLIFNGLTLNKEIEFKKIERKGSQLLGWRSMAPFNVTSQGLAGFHHLSAQVTGIVIPKLNVL